MTGRACASTCAGLPGRLQLQLQLRLCLVTDTANMQAGPLNGVLAAAVQGGVTCIQLRDKHLSDRPFLAQAIALKTWLTPLGIALIINDRVDIALASGADGVHLGQSDMPVEVARRLLPPHVFIGWSVETLDDVARSAQLPVDYLGVSPVFATPTKTDTQSPWGLSGLRQVRAMTNRPLVAIGGITTANAPDVLAAGADGLAAVSALCAAHDPCLAARAFRNILNENSP